MFKIFPGGAASSYRDDEEASAGMVMLIGV
jgi:hypothetical protein